MYDHLLKSNMILRLAKVVVMKREKTKRKKNDAG